MGRDDPLVNYQKKEMQKYYQSVSDTYLDAQRTGVQEKNHNICRSFMMRHMLAANADLRSANVDAYVRDVALVRNPDRSQANAVPVIRDYAAVDAFIDEMMQNIPKKGSIRAQLLVNDNGHYTVVDIKLSQTKKECIVLDAANNSRGKALAQHISGRFDHLYMPAKTADSAIWNPQTDWQSCPYLALQQAAELSKVDIYDHLESLNLESIDNIKNPTWDNMPAQLCLHAQVDRERLQTYQAFYDNQASRVGRQDFMSGQEYADKTARQVANVGGKPTNIGIMTFFDTVRTRTQHHMETKKPMKLLDESEEKAFKKPGMSFKGFKTLFRQKQPKEMPTSSNDSTFRPGGTGK